MDPLTTILIDELTSMVRLLPKVVAALILLLGAWLLAKGAGKGLVRVLDSSQLSKTHRRFFGHVLRWGILSAGVFTALNVVGLQGVAAGMLAGGGVTAVVLGFAFREIGENFLAGVLLAFDRPFDEGDLIRVGDFEGEVRAIDLRNTQIRTPDGRDVFIPNSHIVNGAVVNFTVDGLRRPSFRVGIDYADDVNRALELLVQVVSTIPDVQTEPAPRALIAELSDGWVTLEVAMWVDTFQADVGVARVRSQCMGAARQVLLEQGFTVSSETSTNVALEATEAVPLRLDR